MLGCIKTSTASRSREVIISLCQALLQLHLEYCVHFWAPHCKKDMDILEQVHQTATEMISELEHMTYKETLEKLALFSLQKR